MHKRTSSVHLSTPVKTNSLDSFSDLEDEFSEILPSTTDSILSSNDDITPPLERARAVTFFQERGGINQSAPIFQVPDTDRTHEVRLREKRLTRLKQKGNETSSLSLSSKESSQQDWEDEGILKRFGDYVTNFLLI